MYPFHCTALLDGTRTIDVGTAVDFEVRRRRDGPLGGDPHRDFRANRPLVCAA